MVRVTLSVSQAQQVKNLSQNVHIVADEANIRFCGSADAMLSLLSRAFGYDSYQELFMYACEFSEKECSVARLIKKNGLMARFSRMVAEEMTGSMRVSRMLISQLLKSPEATVVPDSRVYTIAEPPQERALETEKQVEECLSSEVERQSLPIKDSVVAGDKVQVGCGIVSAISAWGVKEGFGAYSLLLTSHFGSGKCA